MTNDARLSSTVFRFLVLSSVPVLFLAPQSASCQDPDPPNARGIYLQPLAEEYQVGNGPSIRLQTGGYQAQLQIRVYRKPWLFGSPTLVQTHTTAAGTTSSFLITGFNGTSGRTYFAKGYEKVDGEWSEIGQTPDFKFVGSGSAAEDDDIPDEGPM